VQPLSLFFLSPSLLLSESLSCFITTCLSPS
jgi:hypothetical protein